MRQNELAAKIDLTPAAVSQYEAGTHTPSPDGVERMALVLKVLPTFFFRSPLVRDGDGAFFRSLRRVPQSERDRAESYALIVGELGAILEEHVELPGLNVPEIRLPNGADATVMEDAALRLRAVWAMPPGPIPNVVRLLESNGIITTAVGDFDSRLDAFSLWAGGRAVVVLCSAKGVAKRRRFDAAHELAHLAIHDRPSPTNAEQERQAHRFAAAFLMPPEEIDPWLPRRSNQFELLEEASATWGVSMQAVLFRARALGTLSESSYVRAMRRMSALGWHRDEPVEAGPPETPSILGAAVTASQQSGITVAGLADRLGVPTGRLLRMIAIPEEASVTGAVVELRAPSGGVAIPQPPGLPSAS